MNYLPDASQGYLPYWLLFLAVTSVGNTVQAFLTTKATAQVYARAAARTPSSQITALQTRTFGTWTLLSAVVRTYAAYNITNAVVYQLALWTFVIAAAHFAGEWFVFGTARWGKGLAGPVVFASMSLLWMLSGWAHYVE